MGSSRIILKSDSAPWGLQGTLFGVILHLEISNDHYLHLEVYKYQLFTVIPHLGISKYQLLIVIPHLQISKYHTLLPHLEISKYHYLELSHTLRSPSINIYGDSALWNSEEALFGVIPHLEIMKDHWFCTLISLGIIVHIGLAPWDPQESLFRWKLRVEISKDYYLQ